LYQIHGFDQATPMEETLRTLDDLVRQGFVRYVGVSNWAAWQIAKALGISAHLGLSRFSSLQAYYSVAGRDLEREIVPLLESAGVGLLVWGLSQAVCSVASSRVARKLRKAADVRRPHFRRSTTTGPTMPST
jgi:aryl-alcohol dehydrogenase-like predicted oxidoreductase